MRFVVQQIPLQIAPHIPFGSLTEFHAHEDGFLAWVSPHVGQKSARVRVFLPVVSGHLVQEMTLAMHHFIVA